MLLIGAGGLGSPASLYLAAAGVGTLGIIDADVVDDSNLQRQIVHSTDTLGQPKVQSAKRTIEALNPDVTVIPYEERLTSENVERILADGWDVIVDGADNFPTRYLVNDASVWHGIPVVHGSIYRFEGQVTVFDPHAAPATAASTPRRRRPSSRRAAPKGASSACCPGIVGSLQASEALKLILGAGETLTGRLLLFDALHTTFDEVTVKKDPACPVCGEHAVDHRVHRLRRVLRGAGARMTARPDPADAARRGRRRAPGRGRRRHRSRGARRPRRPAIPPCGAQIFADGEIAPFVNVYLGRRGRSHARRPRHGGRAGQTVILLPAMAGGSS